MYFRLVDENRKSNFRSSINFAGLCWTSQMPPSQELNSQRKKSPVVYRGGKRESDISEIPVTLQDITGIRWKDFAFKSHVQIFIPSSD
ncbi:hypothetical protein TNCV_5081431 [Trichonephila clavipes]|nr:hypothetical protein TNCV_5081431 [Trichonephila clavipes]